MIGIDEIIKEKYTASLMSNAKWRKLLTVLNELQIPVSFAFIDTEKFSDLEHHDLSFVDDYITDCTAHGSFSFKEIYAVRLRENEVLRKISGERYIDNTKSRLLLEKLNKMGKFPIKTEGDFVYITAYQ